MKGGGGGGRVEGGWSERVGRDNNHFTRFHFVFKYS